MLSDLILEAENAIHCWVDSWGIDGVAVSFSGGKDSTVLLHIARSLYPDIPAVFSNTGLEFEEIVRFVKQTENVDIVRPKKPFHQVIKEYGWPVISKKVSRFVSDCQNSSDKNAATVNLRLTGMTRAGRQAPSQMLSKKWRKLIKAPFKCSDVCCGYLKKEPLERYFKESGRRPMVGVMRADSNRRDKLLQHTCNLYDQKHPISYPLRNWTDKDVWEYIRTYAVPYCSVYDKGEVRTGCVFCMFGIQYDKQRFVRLQTTSPKQYDYVVNTLGGKEVLRFLDIPYEEESV